MAGGVLVTTPLVVLFLAMQKHFIRGLELSRH
jgi:multiple sugar transport system permease protein